MVKTVNYIKEFARFLIDPDAVPRCAWNSTGEWGSGRGGKWGSGEWEKIFLLPSSFFLLPSSFFPLP